MKLRFRDNSLRLRLNRREVEELVSGASLEEAIHFPGNTRMSYLLECSPKNAAEAWFQQGVIRVSAPKTQLKEWASGDSIGLYFDLPANGAVLKIAIEKDLECIEGPSEERDPDAFPRVPSKKC
ncbi:MAG: hypothetical protein JO097_11910 [Acidobacteriaceae bacterium]|nr:hypothetical protein [Acidobacteriaceae bacterium]MBV9767380.1 hypothetical protein [Acidobacteriaceae bacterium]